MSNDAKHAETVLAIDKNNLQLQELTKKYSIFFKQDSRGTGLLGQARDFKEQSGLVEINKFEQGALQGKDWRQTNGNYAHLSLNMSAYLEAYTKAYDNLLANNSVENKNNFEETAVKYLRALQATQNCQAKLAEHLNKLLKHDSFKERQSYLMREQEISGLAISQFKTSLETMAVTLAEQQITEPKENGKIDLETAIEKVQSFYSKAYDTSYGVSGFWRLIKNIFQKSDRIKEIEFLTTLSKTEGCNDGIRLQAIILIRNKILDSELFGQDSKLKNILSSLSGTIVSIVEGEPSLAEFLSEHDELYNLMPKNLQDYYHEHTSAYEQKGSFILVNK